MLSFFTRKLTGYVVVRVSGPEKERFINLSVKSGGRFWHYRREGDSYLLRMKPGEFRRLWSVKKRCKVKLELVKKSGLPFWVYPYRKRVGLLLGAVAGVMLVASMSGQLWVLTAEGSQIYSEKQILEAAEQAGVSIGVRFSEFDPVVAANSIMRQLENTEWVSVNTDGVTATVAVKDGREKPQIYEEEGVKNVVAKRSGVVRSVEAEQGQVCVKLDEGVAKGQLLISGVWESYNRWGEKTGHTFTAPARGVVMAETNREFSVELPMKETAYEQTGEKVRTSLSFFGLTIPLWPVQLGEGEYKKETTQTPLYLMDTKMPVSLIEEKFISLQPYEREPGEEELKKRLMRELRNIQQEELGEKGSVLSEEITFEQKGGKMILTANCVCLEDIAEQVSTLYN